MIKDILIKRRIDDYVVIQDAKEKDKIVILGREHGEQEFIIAAIVEWHSRMKSN
jgi:hypothetical protein